ncbi:MAG TPA: EAL domain-containing protein [Noviherbaspirillum sp.]|nr:EAL domain-containing protein [Noviherbaspirillum sp.]
MPPVSPYPAPFDTSTFIFPAEWHALSDLLGGADTGLLFLRDGAILHMNTHLADQLGFDESEVLGKPVEALFPPGNNASDSNEFARTHGGDNANILFMKKNGKPIEFRFIANRIDTLNDARCTIWVLQPVERPGSETLLQAAIRLRAITEYWPDLVLVCDLDTRLSYTNKSFDDIVGPRGALLSELVHKEDLPQLETLFKETAATADSAPQPVMFRLRDHEGTWRHVTGHVRNLLSHPDISGLLLHAHDDTEHVRQQQVVAAEKKRQLHYLNRLFRMAQQPHTNLSSALAVILKASAKALGTHRCAYWEFNQESSAAHCVMAYDDIRQNFVEEMPDAPSSTAFHQLLQHVLRGEQQVAFSNVDQDPRAAVFCEYFRAASIKASVIVPVQGADKVLGLLIFSHLQQARQWRKDETDFADNVAGLIALIFKEVERSKAEAQLRHLAHHDSLTGLPNRHFLFDQAAELFPQVTQEASSLAAFFIDLDGFKKVNDSLGHALGDELLRAAAMRLKNVVRKDDILVRLGGDEFMLLARNLNDMRIADDIALQIVDTMRGAFSLQGRELRISASVGIAIYPFDGSDIDTLMKKADIAMYHAKSAGRDQYQMFDPKLGGGPTARSKLEQELRRAIDERELQHYYQPQIDLRTGKVRCVEALLRWRHPQRGILLPANFLPAAETSGLMHRISVWVLNDACNQLRIWDQHGIGEFKLAINLSSAQLMDRALLSVLENALDRSGIAGHRLEWEIKESTVMQHHTLSAALLDSMSALRIGLSIDDFGTGYSSMSYLKRYPVHKLKIDRSFVSGLPDAEEHCAIADAIISMAQPLGLDVVAEGVETQQQMDYLREHGCDIGQGYFFTQPLTADQFEKWLIRH